MKPYGLGLLTFPFPSVSGKPMGAEFQPLRPHEFSWWIFSKTHFKGPKDAIWDLFLETGIQKICHPPSKCW